jgi:hypothetical protein
MSVNDLVPILQGAIGPVILISGVGLLLLSMTNRFSRVLDRSRQIVKALRTAPPAERLQLHSQSDILYRRAQILRTAITLAIVSVLMAALLVIALFTTTLLHMEVMIMGSALFIASMLSVIASLIFFLLDINRSLAALKLEIESSVADNI